MKHFYEWNALSRSQYGIDDDYTISIIADWHCERTEMIAVLEAHVELFTIMYGSSQILPENNKCIKECCERAMAVLEKAKWEEPMDKSCKTCDLYRRNDIHECEPVNITVCNAWRAKREETNGYSN